MPFAKHDPKFKPTAAQKKAALSLFTCPQYYDQFLQRFPEVADKKLRSGHVAARRTFMKARATEAYSLAARRKWADWGEFKPTGNLTLLWICTAR
jgi:hypothetical protein